jgi:hypothetical protein
MSSKSTVTTNGAMVGDAPQIDPLKLSQQEIGPGFWSGAGDERLVTERFGKRRGCFLLRMDSPMKAAKLAVILWTHLKS